MLLSTKILIATVVLIWPLMLAVRFYSEYNTVIILFMADLFTVLVLTIIKIWR